MTEPHGSGTVHLLDHGYVRLIEKWGSDERIIESARMSTDKGFLGWGPKHQEGCTAEWNFLTDREKTACTCEPKSGDEKLLRYLYEHKHSTPFEFGGMTIEIQAPLIVFREWHRHRTQSYSELSARYTPLPDVNYIPTLERCLMVSGTNKQAGAAKGSNVLTHESVLRWLEQLEQLYVHAQTVYERGLIVGVPKELARLSVSVGRYSRMRASANLRNWLAFLTLRMDPAAQFEIRMYANEVAKILRVHFPRTMELFDEGLAA